MLYLGSAKVADLDTDRDIVAINRKGEIEDNQRAILKDIEGIVLLDGTWSQAKALWWRNAWMLKCQRVILGPQHPSRYGKLRREPRRDGLSTIEAAAMLLAEPRKAARYRGDAATAVSSGCWRNTARRRATMPELAPEAEAEAGLPPPQAGLNSRGLVAYPERAYMSSPPWGHVAEWLRNGLQNRVHQFNSGRGLHQYNQ